MGIIWSSATRFFVSPWKVPIGILGQRVNRLSRLMAQLKIPLIVFALLQATGASFADEFFSAKVEPLLKTHCYDCHSHAKKIKGGLALDSKSGWQKGGDGGPSIVPGKPEDSLLIKALSHAEVDLKMPPKKMLSQPEMEIFREWVKRGAPDPRVMTPSGQPSANRAWDEEFKKRLNWWSLKPMAVSKSPKGPKDSNPGSGIDPIDQMIRDRLGDAKLSPAKPATPEVLLRRLSFVLTGLPPTPEDLEAFLASPTDKAYENFVTKYLQSPHYGERFARQWMDVVRYTDTYGYEWDNPAKGSHEYRDYLIRAFNDDLGYDQFLREQLAGDLLATQRIHSGSGTVESLIAPMFYHMGEHRHGSSLMFNGIHQEMVNNKIDAFSKAFLGMTVACARCHDHKLEAISQHDYYALAALFTTPRWTSRVVDAPGHQDATIARLRELRGQIRSELATLWTKTPITKTEIKKALGDFTKIKTNIEDVIHPVALMHWREKDAPAAWTELKSQWQTARDQRKKANALFQNLADFQTPALPAGWVSEGDGMRHGYVADATPLIALDGETIVKRLLPRGYHTNALSSKLAGALRMPPQHLVPGKSTSIQIAGGEFGGYLVVDDHAFQNETVSFLGNTEPQWRTFGDAELKNGVQQVTIEFATSGLNPNFPPRTGLAAGLPNSDFGYDKRSWIGITRIVASDSPGTPQDELDFLATLFDGPDPKSADDAWKRVSEWYQGAVARWAQDQIKPGDRAILDALLARNLLPNKTTPGSKLAQLVAEYRKVEATVSFSRTANSMDEREVSKAVYPINVRGNVDVSGTLVKPDFLRMFSGRNGVAQSPGSGRLELAEALLDPEHPLTTRVYVNRIWQWVFGTGLVATPDDFGRLGDRPSHPELLDTLARDFQQKGWSTKQMLRRLVLSQTFRQSGTVSKKAREIDPANRLLHHYPTRRLEAEAIRDAMLQVSGRMDPKLYGRPILPPRAVQDGSKRLYSGPLDGEGRRSIYQQMSIMDPPKFLVGFNLPDLKIPTGRRDVTNVPTQALILLNDPFVEAMSKQWATNLVRDTKKDVESRIRAMFIRALGREPDKAEMARWTRALDDFSTTPKTDLLKDEKAWQSLAHAFFNTKEFIYYR